jgi:hypothetical protein
LELREWCRDEGGGFNIHTLHNRRGRARIWSRRLDVGSCTGLLGIREREA